MSPAQRARWARLRSNLQRNKTAINTSWHEFKDFKKLHDDKAKRFLTKPFTEPDSHVRLWQLHKLKKHQHFAQKKGSFFYRRMQSDLVNDYTDIKRHSYNTFM
jgi:hypothetical protein